MATRCGWTCLLGLAVVLAATGTWLHAEIVYVDSEAGNDGNSGGQGQPVRTIAKAAQIVNSRSDPGPTTVRLAPGAYCVTETVVFENKRAYTQESRLMIEATVLPDDPKWLPHLMPIIASEQTPRASEASPSVTETYSLKIKVNHVTVQGLKFLGNAASGNWHNCIERVGKDLDDLLVTQCVFEGDREGAAIYCAALATGNRFVVDHCLFEDCGACVVFWDGPDGVAGRGCAMRYSIVNKAYLSGVWTCQTAEDFEFHHNIITRSEYVWMRSPNDRTTYTIRDCVITDNMYDSGYGTAERVSGPSGPEVSFKQENVVRNGTVKLVKPVMTPEAPSVQPRDYLHIAPGPPGHDLGAGLFTQASRSAAQGAAAPEYGSNPDRGAYAQINGARIYYERYGRGAPILLLHGGSSRIDKQGVLIDLLSPRYEVIAVDTRGHGRSTLGDQPLAYPLLADDMAKLVDALGVGPVTIVGHSDGGTVGYILAAKYPTRVRALVANGAHFRKTGRGGLTPPSNDWIATLTPAMVQSWGNVREPYEKLNPEPDWNRFANKIKELWQSETGLTEEDLKAIRCPVLISHGDKDTFVNLADLVWIREQIRGASLYIAPDGGHSHYREQIEAFGPILTRFLNRVHEQKTGDQQ